MGFHPKSILLEESWVNEQKINEVTQIKYCIIRKKKKAKVQCAAESILQGPGNAPLS